MKRLTCKVCKRKKYEREMNDFFYGDVRMFVLCDDCKKNIKRKLITIQPITEDGFLTQYVAEEI
jgi:NAD-dependent SIR2 family protein deacetylase